MHKDLGLISSTAKKKRKKKNLETDVDQILPGLQMHSL
jgi:hypothetical protein